METAAIPFVIAIASVSGGGKTTVVEQLAKQLPNAKALYFDQYDLEGPEDMMLWLAKGANNNEWNLEPLLTDLKRLLSEPLDFVVLDFPFADQHALSKNFLDFTVFIDTPLDLALSRRLMRDFTESTTVEILGDVQHYAKYGRAAYLHMLSTIKDSSDLVVDGTPSITEVVQSIAENIPCIRKSK